jgi:TPP-dependent pyruvate/acetoin dehydrogenase alpha subunit
VVEAGLLDEADFDAIEATILALIDEAVAEAIAAPFPDPARDLTRDVYVKYA